MRYLNFCQWVQNLRHDFRNLKNTHYNSKHELNNSVDVTYPLEYVFLSVGLWRSIWSVVDHIITSPHENSWLVNLASRAWFPTTKCCVRKLEFPCCFYEISFHNSTHPPFHSSPFQLFLCGVSYSPSFSLWQCHIIVLEHLKHFPLYDDLLLCNSMW